MQQGVDVVVKNAQGEEVGRVSSSGEITPAAQQPAAQSNQGNWGIWATSINRFVRAPGQSDNSVLRRYPSREAAEQFLAQTRAETPNIRTDVEVREIEPATTGNWGVWVPSLDRFSEHSGQGGDRTRRFNNQSAAQAWIQDYNTRNSGNELELVAKEIEPSEPVPGSTLDLQRQRAAQQGVDTSVPYELYNRNTGAVIDTFPALNDDEARVRLDDYRNLGAGQFNPEAFGVRRGPGVTNTASSQRSNATPQTPDQAQDGIIDVEPDVAQNFAPQTLTRPGQGQQVFTGDWKVLIDGEQVYQFRGIGNNQGDANRVGRDWVRQQVRQGTLNPANGADIEVLPVMGEAE